MVAGWVFKAHQVHGRAAKFQKQPVIIQGGLQFCFAMHMGAVLLRRAVGGTLCRNVAGD